jgi:hypothetical protein
MGSGAAYVVAGPPAVGKSTVARLLAGAATRGVHVPVDDLREMVVSGLVLPSPDWPAVLADQVAAAREVALTALTAYAVRGYTVVIDDFVDPAGLREYDDVVGSGAVTAVVLRPDPEAAIGRARQREVTAEGAAYITEGVRMVSALLEDLLPRLTTVGWHVVDNTDLDPGQTAARIRAL